MSILFLYSIFGIILTWAHQQNQDLTHIHIHPNSQFGAQKSKGKTHKNGALQVLAAGRWKPCWCPAWDDWCCGMNGFISQLLQPFPLLLQDVWQPGSAGRSPGSGLEGAAPPGEPLPAPDPGNPALHPTNPSQRASEGNLPAAIHQHRQKTQLRISALVSCWLKKKKQKKL